MREKMIQVSIYDQAAHYELMQSGIAREAENVLRETPQITPTAEQARTMALESFLLSGNVLAAAREIANAPESTIQMLREQRHLIQPTREVEGIAAD